MDDDAGSSYQTYYANAIAAAGRTYDTWTVSSQGSPSLATLQQLLIQRIERGVQCKASFFMAQMLALCERAGFVDVG